jgi:hypothetical protein
MALQAAMRVHSHVCAHEGSYVYVHRALSSQEHYVVLRHRSINL